MTNAEKIIALLSKSPGLDDDEISSHANIRPRQQVNQICRQLEAKGKIKRVMGPRGKVINFVASNGGHRPQEALKHPPSRRDVDCTSSRGFSTDRADEPKVENPELDEIGALDLGSTLIIIPCSGSKATGRGQARGPSLADFLPKSLGEELLSARSAVARKSKLDESTLLPAWQRYTGMLYQSAMSQLEAAVVRGQEVAILSGGYGLLLATEPIGCYERVFKYADWPRGLLEQALLNYVRVRKIEHVAAFVSASTGYRSFLNRVDWGQSGLRTVSFVVPEATTGAMVKAPRAQGEALAALLSGTLTKAFASSDGLRLEVQQLVIN